MLSRTMVLFTLGLAAVLFAAADTDAQPSKSPFGKGKGPGAGADVQKLQRDLDRLLEQVQDTKAKLARLKEAAGQKKGGFDRKGKGGFGPKGFDKGKGKGGEKGKGKGGDFKKKFEPKKQFGKGFEGKKLDPDTIRQRYEFYKKLFDELPKTKGKGKGFEGKGPGGPKGPGPKGFEGKGKGPGGPKGFGPKGFEGKKPGPMGGGPGGSVEARIDRLIRELEQLRSEVRGGKKK